MSQANTVFHCRTGFQRVRCYPRSSLFCGARLAACFADRPSVHFRVYRRNQREALGLCEFVFAAPYKISMPNVLFAFTSGLVRRLDQDS